MSDERLLARLRGRGNKDTIAAADRIEALTEQLEAARADAKEAEAYAEELEREIELNEQEACMLENDFIKADKEIDALKAKLAKAVEAASPLLNMDVWTESAEDDEMVIVSVGTVRRIRAALAEIEGEKT